MDLEHIAYLAMHGAANILAKRRDPEGSWAAMRRGEFTKRRAIASYPLIVRALALRDDATVEEAQATYQSLSETDRKRLKTDPEIRYYRLKVQLKEAEAKRS